MFLADPRFYQLFEILGFLYQIIRLRFGCNICSVVVNVVPLAAADIKVGDEGGDLRAHHQLQHPERRLMMTEPHNSVSFTRDHHLRELQDRIICGGEAAVGGER